MNFDFFFKWFEQSRFWLRLGFVFMAGCLSALSMAPYHFLPALFIGLSVLYLALSYTKGFWQNFALGWSFGFGYFLCSLYWVANSLLVEGNDYAWAYPIAVCGLPALLAFFPAIASTFTSKYFNLKTLLGFLGFVAALSFSEWLRGHILTGFPWNLYGYAWGGVPEILQSLNIANVYVLTGFTIFICALPGYVLVSNSGMKIKITLPILAALILSGMFFYGYQRLQTPQQFHDITIKVIQPNIAQSEKWDPLKIPAHFQKFLRLSQPHGQEEFPTYIIWPETAISQRHLNDPIVMQALSAMLQSYPKGASLFTGVLRHNEDRSAYFNSLIMINDSGEIQNIYDKSHLVPFGEYIPFQDLIPLQTINQFSGFQPGQGITTHTTPEGLGYSPLVCYEILFPDSVIHTQNKPDFIVNVTNDAWYGNSTGPHQHLQKARFRAIEEGIPVLRSVNTGISAIIDSYGRVLSQGELHQEKILEFRLPQSK